ncbi:hypothetical protein QFC20_005426 [Naganishia adeliensis]|uniref:Uncharacterized protein n=1 Tax=Naganishia adeliensis TaxID=92952 RepID=A0ACC2VLS0_9TREE|nr:hypothetical protein QFC20_005426 [Naganishia adeliensis]
MNVETPALSAFGTPAKRLRRACAGSDPAKPKSQRTSAAPKLHSVQPAPQQGMRMFRKAENEGTAYELASVESQSTASNAQSRGVISDTIIVEDGSTATASRASTIRNTEELGDANMIGDANGPNPKALLVI